MKHYWRWRLDRLGAMFGAVLMSIIGVDDVGKSPTWNIEGISRAASERPADPSSTAAALDDKRLTAWEARSDKGQNRDS